MFVRIEELDTVEPAGGRSLADDVLAEVAGRLTAPVRRPTLWPASAPPTSPCWSKLPRGATATAVGPARIPDGVRLPLLEHDHPLALIASIGVATASCGRDADQLVRRPR